MNKYKLIYKRMYDFDLSSNVYLVEYMLYGRYLATDKFVILKIHNHTLDKITKIRVEIKELNNVFEVLKESTYEIDQLNLDSMEETVLLQKFRIQDECESIICNVSVLQIEEDEVLQEEQVEEEKQEEIIEKKTEMNTEEVECLKYKLTEANHRGYSFPYIIPVFFVFVFILFVILVFNTLN